MLIRALTRRHDPQQLTDYWYYTHRSWEFDLILSNPDSVRLYQLAFAKYAAQVGCQDH